MIEAIAFLRESKQALVVVSELSLLHFRGNLHKVEPFSVSPCCTAGSLKLQREAPRCYFEVPLTMNGSLSRLLLESIRVDRWQIVAVNGVPVQYDVTLMSYLDLKTMDMATGESNSPIRAEYVNDVLKHKL